MRISQADEDRKRKKDRQPSSPSGTQTSYNRVNLKFPKQARIRSKAHYQKIYYEGRRLSGSVVGASLRFKSPTGPKLGITVSKRHGKAHERNLFKRRAREAFRHACPLLPPQVEFSIFPRLPLEKITRAGIEADLLRFVGVSHAPGESFKT